MSQTVQTQPQTQRANATEPAAAQAPPAAPTIAVRNSCNPDGIGLSHYVLMDRKVAK